MSEYVAVAKVNQIKPGKVTLVKVGGEDVALFNIAGAFFAIADTCTHDGGSLSEGDVSGHVVACPNHGSEFDVRTGAAVGPPADEPVKAYQVKVEGEDVLIAKG